MAQKYSELAHAILRSPELGLSLNLKLNLRPFFTEPHPIAVPDRDRLADPPAIEVGPVPAAEVAD